MADKTIPQTAPIGLPAKHYYTLQEVAERWTRMMGNGVSVDDVLRYEETLELKISAYLSCLDGVFIRQVLEGDKIETRDPMGYEGIIFPVSLGIPIYSQFRHNKSFEFLSLWIKDSPPFVNACFYVCDKDGNNKKAVLPADSLRVTREELHRFEEAHGIGKPAQLPKPQEASEDTKAARLERALGALALGLAKDAPKWRNGVTPNVSKLTEAAMLGIKENEDGKPKHGYGETTIYETISAAIKTVQKDQATR